MDQVVYQKGQHTQVLTDEIISDLRKQWHLELAKAERNIPRLSIGESEFNELMVAFGSILLAKKRSKDKFEITADNMYVIHQLYLYTSKNAEFCGDLSKGIALVGKIGCGKTLIMEAYSHLINYIISKNELQYPLYQFVSASEMVYKAKDSSIYDFTGGALIIDEFGREAKVVNNYGTVSIISTDILFERYRHGRVTHVTANFTLEDLSDEEMYGKMLGDRLKEMLNFIEMKGGSKRK